MQGFRNDLQEAMDQVDEEYMREIIQGHSSGNHDVVVEDEGLTIKDIKVFIYHLQIILYFHVTVHLLETCRNKLKKNLQKETLEEIAN